MFDRIKPYLSDPQWRSGLNLTIPNFGAFTETELLCYSLLHENYSKAVRFLRMPPKCAEQLGTCLLACQQAIVSSNGFADTLRDIELPSPFWPYEQNLFVIFDDLLYGLRAALRSSTMELEEMKRLRYYGTEFTPNEANTPLSHGSPATEHHFPSLRPTEMKHIDIEFSEEVDGRGLQQPRQMRPSLLDGHLSRFGGTKNRHMHDMIDLPMTY